MNIIGALLNAVAVWFVLKAVEVVPFAVYDLFVLVKECFSNTEHDLTDQSRPHNRFDKHRGKLDFVFSGAGFFQFSTCQRSKRLFLVAALVPLLIFVLEIFSIFLGNETRICQTSRDPNVVKAPALRLFGEGEREVNAIDLDNEIVDSGLTLRPCLRRQWTYSGVEYVASMCSDLRPAIVASILVRKILPENDRMSIVLRKSIEDASDLIFWVVSSPSKNSFRNATRVVNIDLISDVFVNGKRILRNDVTRDVKIDEFVTKQIRNDVRLLELVKNSAKSKIVESSNVIVFDSVDSDDILSVTRNVVHAVISQSRRIGLRPAAEMSVSNAPPFRELPEVDILCEEDFFLPRTVSIIIIVTGTVLRVLLLAVPTSLSSAEYALLHSEKGEEYSRTTKFSTGRPTTALA